MFKRMYFFRLINGVILLSFGWLIHPSMVFFTKLVSLNCLVILEINILNNFWPFQGFIF